MNNGLYEMVKISSNSKAAFPFPGPRIVVVGATGSGKTTTAAQLARILGKPHIELDSLHWQPNWVMMERETFRQLVAQALSGQDWVIDGNYSKARDLIWGRATTIVWLDYSLPVILWQLTWRTLKRVLTREELWNGNKETLRGAFFSKDSLFLWAISHHPRYRRMFPQLFDSPEYAHLQVVRLRTRRETAAWLKGLEEKSINEN
jgi:energy-coupling factor transporter ATP-binding protein EcfA2